MDGDRLRHELDSLLHPGSAFGHPCEVANDPDLTVNEKRAILSAWASDASASEVAPHMRPTATGTASPPPRFAPAEIGQTSTFFIERAKRVDDVVPSHQGVPCSHMKT